MKTINLELHPEKSQVYPLHKGVKFLGYRIFYHHKLLNKKNIRKIETMVNYYKKGLISLDETNRGLAGWSGYAIQTNTYKMRKRIRREIINSQKLETL